MSGMFNQAIKFDQPINTKEVIMNNKKYTTWNVSKVTEMNYMFQNAPSFNQDISNWNTSNLKLAYAMFQEATSFDQNINTKEVSVVIKNIKLEICLTQKIYVICFMMLKNLIKIFQIEICLT
ncbi:hypothetical protein MCCPF38_00731 [Mycoplasma capricolum subsp. capripneumoniae]|nr:hypothetical protein MCCPF38_00731 [Mycoplasma capricolum subsp. capripneumoniae]